MKFEWRSETWQKRGDGFLVEIKRWVSAGNNHWNVYAYIFPEHPIFKQIKSEKLWVDHDIAEYFHFGPSFHKWHKSDGHITCKQIGSDYEHYQDHYERMERVENSEIEYDAEELFEYLQENAERKIND